MKTIIAIIFILTFTFGHAQETSKDETKKTLAFRQIKPEDKFASDVKRNSFTVYTVGGLKPYDHKTTEMFQKKYNVTYHNFGCIAPGNMDYYEQYNLLVFQHLNKKFSPGWEKDIKDNAIGFYKWFQAK